MISFCACSSFLSLRYLPNNIYANGAEINIDEYDQAKIPIPIVKANCWTTPVPRRYIAIITRSVENTVPNDLLMVCQILRSKITPNSVFLPAFSFIFSLILSKTIIVSLILYPMLVRSAIIRIESIATVWSKAIHKPYAHAGIATSNIAVTTTTPANSPGEISFLIAAKENNI